MVTATRPIEETTEQTEPDLAIDLMDHFYVHSLKVQPRRRPIRQIGAMPNEIAQAIIERSHRRSRKHR